jgi:hypothetical protein
MGPIEFLRRYFIAIVVVTVLRVTRPWRLVAGSGAFCVEIIAILS